MQNRETKYRVWDKANKRFCESFVLDITSWNIPGLQKRPVELNNYIFQQFTGQKDKDGKEIFEGDILEIKRDKGRLLVEVNWDTYGYNLEEILDGARFYGEQYIVIGNMCENEDLFNINGIAYAQQK